MLLQENLIRVRKGHVIPPPEELAIRDYCKWHNSFSHSTNGCNVFRRQVQSAISDGRLAFLESSKMKFNTDPFPINLVDFTDKKMFIRSDQTESARGNFFLIDDNAPPRIIRPKHPEGGWKINKKKKQSAPIPKPTINQLFDKYTSRKANNLFSRLRGMKHLRSPSRPGGHERWRENSYKQRPYFPVYPLWGFSPSAPYHTRPTSYFQSGWISSRPMFRQYLHEKRAQINPETRPCDAIVVRGGSERSHFRELSLGEEDTMKMARTITDTTSLRGCL
jgi:hypothetical protein